MSERHEIPEPQAKRLAEIKSLAEDAVAETIRAKARMYDALMVEGQRKEVLKGCIMLIAEFLELDLNKGYRLDNDGKAFVLGDSE